MTTDGVLPERVTLPFGTFIVHDLSPVFEEGMPGWHTHPPLRIDKDARSHGVHGYFAQTLVINEHTGSHVDAPAHVLDSARASTVDMISPVALIARYKKYDLRPYGFEAGELVPVEVFHQIELQLGFELDEGDIVLLDFGWERFVQPGKSASIVQWWGRNQPGLSEEACEYFALAKIRAVGSNTAACDSGVVDGRVTGNFGHEKYFLPRGILIIEGLRNLSSIPTVGVFLAIPLRIWGGSGSPIRPICLEEWKD